MTREVSVDVLVVGHRTEWQKWPDTGDMDYDPLLSRVEEASYVHEDVVFRVRRRFYPVYEAFLHIPGGRESVRVHYPVIDNTKPLPEAVVDRHIGQITALAAGERVLWWEHAYLCRPRTMAALADRYPLKVLHFGDDAPGSSDVKTFPVAHGFDALHYSMYVWDFDSGRLTADQYRSRGCPKAYLTPSTRSRGLDRWCGANGFDLGAKVAAVGRGDPFPYEFVWIGALGGCRWRQNLLHAMNAWPQTGAGVKVDMWGWGLRNGTVGPWHPPEGDGIAVAPVYAKALLGVNLQHSSIFNTRLRDLWQMGVVQFIHDRHRELEVLGAKPGVHFVPFDGTHEGLLQEVRAWRNGPRERMTAMMFDAAAFEAGLDAVWSPAAVFGKILADHEGVVARPAGA